jgi:hypothetical protein
MIASTLRGERPLQSLKIIDEVGALSKSARQADGGRIATLFSSEVTARRASFIQAWCVLAEAPDALYRSQRIVTMSVTSQLLRQHNVDWSGETAAAWKNLLTRAKILCEPRVYLRHCVQALAFSLSNSRLPISALVCSAFPTVYSAVFEEVPYQDEANGLLSYDWDRAKGLRRNLVDCFYQSKWPEGDLALTAAESFGLRKLFRRLWRKWSGEGYVSRMIADLRRRNDPRATACMNELIGYYEKPHFHEPWD